MIALENRASTLFRIGVWMFAVTLFADASNFDDLFSDSVILHSDEEATAQTSMDQDVLSGAIGCPGGTLPAQLSLHGPATLHPHSGLVILDQDSPSLAAERTMSEEVSFIVPQQEAVLYHCTPVAESLYLKFRVLLI